MLCCVLRITIRNRFAPRKTRAWKTNLIVLDAVNPSAFYSGHKLLLLNVWRRFQYAVYVPANALSVFKRDEALYAHAFLVLRFKHAPIKRVEVASQFRAHAHLNILQLAL